MLLKLNKLGNINRLNLSKLVVMLSLFFIFLSVSLIGKPNFIKKSFASSSIILAQGVPLPTNSSSVCGGSQYCIPSPGIPVNSSLSPAITSASQTASLTSVITQTPCTRSTNQTRSIRSRHNHHHKHGGNGGISSSLAQLINMLIQLLNQIIAMLGGTPVTPPGTTPSGAPNPSGISKPSGTINNPSGTLTNPSTAPVNPCPPSTAPIQPVVNPTQPVTNLSQPVSSPSGSITTVPPTTGQPIVSGSPISSMTVGLNAGGWGIAGVQDIATAVGYARLETSTGEPASDFYNNGVKVNVLISGTCPSCGYSSGGVSTIDPNAWATNALSWYQTNCSQGISQCPSLEVLNEEYGSWFWGSNAESQANATAMGALIDTVYNTFHAQLGANSPKIIASIYNDSTWWNEVKSGTPDVVAHLDGDVEHPYGGGAGTSTTLSAEGNRALVTDAHNATGLPIYITEVGWPTAIGQPGTGDSQQWTDQQQANNICNFINWAKTTGYVAAVYIFGYRDYDTNMFYGVETSTGTKKPSFTSLSEAAKGQACND